MTKHFVEEEGSCFLGEKMYTLKELATLDSPPKPPLMRVGVNGNPCPLCGSGMKPNWLRLKSKGCYQPECENYWRKR